MKSIFTLIALLTVISIANSQVIWEGSFEESDGFNGIGSTAKGSANWVSVINNTSEFWHSMWSDANPRTMVASIDGSAHSGSQSIRFDSGSENGNPRFRTDKTGYTNGDTIKISYWAKTNEAGVNYGGKLMSITKGIFSNVLSTSYQQFTDYGKIANGRVQLFFKSSTATDSFSVWIDDVKIEYSDEIPVVAIDPEYSAFPVTDDFEAEAYQLNSTICSYDGSTESDLWPVTEPKVIDRFWRGNKTTSYTASIDAVANGGNKALKIHANTMALNEFKLRTVNIPVGKYTVKFHAKTDEAGVGTAKIGFAAEIAGWESLSSEYQQYMGEVEVIVAGNGTTRLVLFFLSSVESTEAMDFNVWIDDLIIEEGWTTTIKNSTSSELVMYPNPVHSKLFLKGFPNDSQVNIYNLAGMKVFSTMGNIESIDVRNLEAGTYILQVESMDKRLQKHFIKY